LPKSEWITLTGQLKKGYRVASGPSEAYPEYGSIEKQKPYFKELGLNLDHVFNGTLNVSIEPYEFEIIKPQYRFTNVKWTELTNAEDFSFSRCRIKFQELEYDGFVYYPDPKTKKEHFQDMSTVEVLAPHIREIKYGNELELLLNTAEIKITKKDKR
jgi:hypothetical protein